MSAPGRIRLATPDDAPQVAAIYAPIVAETFISFETDPPDAVQMRARIAKTLEMFPWLVMEGERGVAGFAYASRHRERSAYRWSVDVSCYVAEASRAQGVGRALYTKLLALLSRQGFHAAFAGIALPNDASVRLHESVGFEPVGIYREVGFKLGAWHDTGWWQKRLVEGTAAPAEPLPLHRLGPGVLDHP